MLKLVQVIQEKTQTEMLTEKIRLINYWITENIGTFKGILCTSDATGIYGLT